MKKGSPISWPVLVVLAVGILLTAAVIKFAPSKPPEKSPAETALVTKESNAAAPENPAPVEAAAEIPAAGELPPVIPVPLTNFVIDAENGSWLRDKEYLLAPHTPQDFGGVRFLMDGLVQLQGRLSRDWKNRKYRDSVTIPLSLTNRIGALHLLGGTRYGSDQSKCADIIWQYADGTSRQVSMTHQMDIRDWVRSPYEQPAHLPNSFSKCVWVAPQPAHPGQWLRLYRTTFANPEPTKIPTQLRFVSSLEDPTLFFCGVTLDPLKPGQRPDDSQDLEPGDPYPANHLQIFVQNTAGAPVPGAKLQIQIEQHADKNPARSSSSLKTDGSGAAEVLYPPQNLDTLQVTASQDDYGGRRVMWNVKGGETVPASYTLKLEAGAAIGGIVVDPENNPITGASVSVYRFWRGSDDDDRPNQSGDHADFSRQTQKTDADGRWRVKSLPVTLLSNIGMDVSHPDFVGTNANVSQAEQQFRDETYKFVLKRGLVVQGRVVDDQENPIAAATVWAGKKYYRDRQQTKSDSQGRFTFRNVNDGEMLFSVMADGHGADSKTVAVHTGMDEIVFKLGAGSVIRAVVQNESGEAVSGARVGLEGSPGDPGYDAYEFSATTDSNGKFQWNSAPNETMQFYVFHDGYEAKRNAKLAPNQDNVITLHASRQLQGQVLDATTAQPIAKFRIRTGNRPSPETKDVYGVVQYHDFSSADGRFSTTLSEESDNAVAVYADGYADTIVSFPDAQNGTVQVVARMKPSAGISGIVLAPDGTPAPGVGIAAVSSPGPGAATVQLSNGRLQSYSRTKIVTSDSEGKFQIPSAPEDGGFIVAAGLPGFASASIDNVRASSAINLQAWGRIEGTLKIAGQPAPGKDMMIQLDNIGVYPDWNGYKATTDEQGAFKFEKVPPGDVSIIRLVQTSPNSWTHSYKTDLQVQPGQTTTITLGDSGAVVKGTARFEVTPTNVENLTISGDLSTAMPASPSFNSQSEAQAYYQSGAWKDQMKQRKSFAFVVAKDGTFTVDSVPPGSYSINISARYSGERAWSQPPVANGFSTITVPDNATPFSEIYAGEILLRQPSALPGYINHP